MAREVIVGVIGGAVGAGLMKLVKPPPPPPLVITPAKTVIAKQTIPAGGTVTLLPSTSFKFAIILFHGDGDSQVRLDVTVDNTTVSIYGNDQAIELLANQTIVVTAVNTDTTARSSPTIEIAYLSW